jgi:hypothetical protein
MVNFYAYLSPKTPASETALFRSFSPFSSHFRKKKAATQAAD